MSNRRVYRNPPILEAVCEFRFVPGAPWDWTIPGLFFGRVRGEFPEKKHQNVVDIGLEAQGESVKQVVKGGVARVQLMSPETGRQIGLGPDVLSVHVTRPYPGWETFGATVESALHTYMEVASPVGLRRAGVRYINRIDIPRPAHSLDEYLTVPPRITPGLPQTLHTFLGRMEIVLEPEVLLLQTLAISPPETTGITSCIFDLDVVMTPQDQPRALTNAMQIVHRLRALERDAFEAGICDAARSIFDG